MLILNFSQLNALSNLNFELSRDDLYLFPSYLLQHFHTMSALQRGRSILMMASSSPHNQSVGRLGVKSKQKLGSSHGETCKCVWLMTLSTHFRSHSIVYNELCNGEGKEKTGEGVFLDLRPDISYAYKVIGPQCSILQWPNSTRFLPQAKL